MPLSACEGCGKAVPLCASCLALHVSRDHAPTQDLRRSARSTVMPGPPRELSDRRLPSDWEADPFADTDPEASKTDGVPEEVATPDPSKLP